MATILISSLSAIRCAIEFISSLYSSSHFFIKPAASLFIASFIKNYIDPKGKTERANRENLRTLYDTIANHTETSQDAELDREILRQNLSRATEAFLGNTILTKEFNDVGVDFPAMLKQEETYVFKRYAPC